MIKCQNNIHKDKKVLIKQYANGEKISSICAESGVSRSTFYKWLQEVEQPVSHNDEKITISEQLQELVNVIFHEYQQIPGPGKIVAILSERGYITTRKLVVEVISELGLQSISSTSKKNYQKWQNAETKTFFSSNFTLTHQTVFGLAILRFLSFTTNITSFVLPLIYLPEK